MQSLLRRPFLSQVRLAALVACALAALAAPRAAEACTSYLVTRGASVDGSTMISYAADSLSPVPTCVAHPR